MAKKKNKRPQRKKSPLANQPKVRSLGTVAMLQRGGEGAHGKYKRSKNRAERQSTKRELKGGYYA